MSARGVWLAALIGTSLVVAAEARDDARETRGQMQRIVAHAVCLAVGYPDTPLAADAERVIATYGPLLGGRVDVKRLSEIRALARAAEPAKPMPVGQSNFAIARCTLFAERPDVARLLGNQRD